MLPDVESSYEIKSFLSKFLPNYFCIFQNINSGHKFGFCTKYVKSLCQLNPVLYKVALGMWKTLKASASGKRKTLYLRQAPKPTYLSHKCHFHVQSEIRGKQVLVARKEMLTCRIRSDWKSFSMIQGWKKCAPLHPSLNWFNILNKKNLQNAKFKAN